MSKDPAFLFYSSDFLTGTYTMTDEQVGRYIRLLCLQHQQGHLTENHMVSVCKTYDEAIWSKFTIDASGRYYSQRLDEEVQKREKYSDSRRLNGVKGGRPKSEIDNHMDSICKAYENHSENENENINVPVITTKEKGSRGKPFTKPTLDEITSYCTERNNSISGQAFLDYYESNGWMVGRNKMKDWQATVRSWESRDKKTGKSGRWDEFDTK